MADWASAADVMAFTGAVVTADQITRAQSIIMIAADVSPDSSFDSDDPSTATGLISPKNLRYLKMAVAYQAAWMLAHPDVFTNIDVKDVSEDGLSFTAGNTDSNVLAPLARKCVRRLTWMRPNRSIRVQPRLNPAFSGYFGNRDSVMHDEERPWSPL